jgi:hypothetical protein
MQCAQPARVFAKPRLGDRLQRQLRDVRAVCLDANRQAAGSGCANIDEIARPSELARQIVDYIFRKLGMPRRISRLR